MRNLHLVGILTLGSLLSACGGDSGSGSSGTQTPTNQAPSATSTTATILQDSGTVDIALSGTDPDGSALTYAIAAQPTKGSVAINNNVVTYTPNAGYAGADSFTFTVNDGALTSSAASVDLTVQAASKFQGEVNKPDGTDVPSPIITAMDSDGNEVITVTGEADGTFLLNALTEQPLTLKFTADGYADQVIPVTMPAQQSTNLPLDVVMIERGAEQTLDIDAGGSLSGDNGASVTLTAGSFVDANGAAVTGNITATITPVDVSRPEVLAAFPGDFTGIEDLNNTETLIVSLGTTEYVFTQNGEPIQIANGSTADIKLPIFTTVNPQTGDPVAMGEEIDLWSLNEDTGIWVQEGTGVVVANTSSPTGLALEAIVSHFSWWNVDYPIVGADVDVTVNGSVTGGVAIIHARLEGLSGFRTTNSNVDVGSTKSGLAIPSGQNTCFWIEYLDMAGATALSDEQCINNAIPNGNYPLTFNVPNVGALQLNQSLFYLEENFANAPISIDIDPSTLETAVSYVVTAGSLPSGLSLSNSSTVSGLISGSSNILGSYLVTVTGTDSDGFSDSREISFSIFDTPPPQISLALRALSKTVFLGISEPYANQIRVVSNGGDIPTSWIVTLDDGSQVPAGVNIDGQGVFRIDSFDGVTTSYLISAYNAKGASNTIQITMEDNATQPPELPSSYNHRFGFGAQAGTVQGGLSFLNRLGPATSWTIARSDGLTLPSSVSISSNGRFRMNESDASQTYIVTASNANGTSGPMILTLTGSVI